MMSLVILGSLLGLTISQDCNFYDEEGKGTVIGNNWKTWSSSDWPNSLTQDFQYLIDYNQNTGVKTSNNYLDHNDLISGGQFEGQTWQEAFYSDSANLRPLGYKFAQIAPYNAPILCLRANGAANYAVDLMIYTLTPRSNICASDMDTDQFSLTSNSIMKVCGVERLYYCFSAINGDNTQIRVAVYCNEGCDNGEPIDVLYRFRRSSVPFGTTRTGSTTNPEMWCNMIADKKDWPDDIDDALPSNYVIQATSNANRIVGIVAVSIVALVMMFM